MFPVPPEPQGHRDGVAFDILPGIQLLQFFQQRHHGILVKLVTLLPAAGGDPAEPEDVRSVGADDPIQL